MNNEQMAEAIYREIEGGDDRETHARTVSEILDWLDSGQPTNGESAQDLANEYLDYIQDAKDFGLLPEE